MFCCSGQKKVNKKSEEELNAIRDEKNEVAAMVAATQGTIDLVKGVVRNSNDQGQLFSSTRFNYKKDFMSIRPNLLAKSIKSIHNEPDQSDLEVRMMAMSGKTVQTVQTVQTIGTIQSMSPTDAGMVSKGFKIDMNQITIDTLNKMKHKFVETIIKAATRKLKVSKEEEVDIEVHDYHPADYNGERINLIPLHDFLTKLKDCVNSWTEEDEDDVRSMGYSVLIIANLYLRRLKKLNPSLIFTYDNIRNLYLVAIMVATKVLDDYLIPTRYWADLVSCELEHLKEMEHSFLTQIDYQLHINLDAFQQSVQTLSKIDQMKKSRRRRRRTRNI